MSRVGSNFFYVGIMFYPLFIGRAGASKTRRVITLLSVGWLPPAWPPSGACLTRGPRIPCGLFTLPRGTPHRGCASSDRQEHPGEFLFQRDSVLRGPRTLLGKRPHEGTPCSGHGDPDLMRLFTCGQPLAIPLAKPDLGLPTDGLDGLWELCQTPWQVTTDFRWIPVCPGAFHQGTTCVGMACLGHAALLTPCPTRICRRRQPQIMQKRSGGLEARQVTQCGPRRHGPRALDTAQGLERLDDRRQAPGVPLLVACACQTAQPFRLCGDGLDVCLTDQVLRWGRTAHLAAPAQGGRAPGGSPGRAASVPPHEGLETQLGRLQSPEGLCPCPTQVPEGCIVDGRHRHRGEVPGAHEPGQLPSVTTVGLDPIARLLGNQGGSDDPADVAWFHQVTREPRTAGTGFVDQDARRALRLQLPSQLSNSALPGSDRAEGDDLRAMGLGDVGDRTSLFVDISSARKRARLVHGGPPSLWQTC
jgi:hypothetical protein